MTWGQFESAAFGHLWHGTVANIAQTALATMWLIARLPGSGKRAPTVVRQGDGGGDNGTEPSSGVGASSPSSGPLPPVAGANVSSDPTLVHVNSSAPSGRVAKRSTASALQSGKWFQTYEQLRDWLQSHSDVYPRRRALAEEEKALANLWITTQRSTVRENCLFTNRIS